MREQRPVVTREGSLGHPGTPSFDFGEGFADGVFELGEMFCVVVHPCLDQLAEGERPAIARGGALPVGRREHLEDGEACLTLEGEAGEEVFFAVAGVVTPRLPVGAIDEMHRRVHLGEHAFKGHAAAEEFIVSEVGEDRAGAPLSGPGFVEQGVGGLSDEVGKGGRRLGKAGEQVFHRLTVAAVRCALLR